MIELIETLMIETTQLFSLKLSDARSFGQAVLVHAAQNLLRSVYRCREFMVEVDGCDLLLRKCTAPGSMARSVLLPSETSNRHQKPDVSYCHEGKYIENLWPRRSVVRREFRHARRKMQDAGVPLTHVIVTSFVRKRVASETSTTTHRMGGARDENHIQPPPQPKFYIPPTPYRLLVIVVKAEAVREKPDVAAKEAVGRTQEYVTTNDLEAVTNMPAHIIHLELQVTRAELDELHWLGT